MSLSDRKLLAVITGASRGIGREAALQLAKIAASGSAFLITARSADPLEELKIEILDVNPELEVLVVVCDAAQLNAGKTIEFEVALASIISFLENSADALLLVHNAGTIGDISKQAVDLRDSVEWHEYLQTNLVSMILLNNLVLKTVTDKICPTRIIVNITSIMAQKAFPSFAQYSVGKAAREAFFRSLAKETPGLRVLNYSPGPVLTNMYDEVAKRSYDAATREAFKRRPKTAAEGNELLRTTLTPEETVQRLLSIVDANKFENGARIDYFDVQE